MTVAEAAIADPLENLRDLLDLEEAGEGVVWPPNIDANYARSILSEIAICTAVDDQQSDQEMCPIFV